MTTKIWSYFLGPAAAQVIGLLALPIFTRTYSKEMIGEFQLIVMVSTFLTPIISLNHGSLLLGGRSLKYVNSSFLCWLLLASLPLLFVALQILESLRVNLNLETKLLIFFYFFSTAGFSYLALSAVDKARPLKYSFAITMNSMLQNILKIGLGMLFQSLNSILGGFVIAQILSGYFLFEKRGWITIRLKYFFRSMRKNIKFQLGMTFSQLVGILVEWLPIALLPALGYGAETVAEVGLAYLFVRAIPGSLGDAVLYAGVNDIKAKSINKKNSIFYALLILSATVLVFLFCEMYGGQFFAFWLGDEWAVVAVYCQLILPSFVTVLFLNPLVRGFVILVGKNRMLPIFDVFGMLVIVAICFVIGEHDLEIFLLLVNLVYFATGLTKVVYLSVGLRYSVLR